MNILGGSSGLSPVTETLCNVRLLDTLGQRASRFDGRMFGSPIFRQPPRTRRSQYRLTKAFEDFGDSGEVVACGVEVREEFLNFRDYATVLPQLEMEKAFVR